MKSNQEIIDLLNFLLADELTAINQYFVHAEMCADWGYEGLHESIEERAITEMKHAEGLIARILFLEGTPVVGKLNELHIAESVEDMLASDHAAELGAIKGYREGIKLAVDHLDFGTRELLESNLKQEEEHIDYIEEQQDQIEQMGIQNYLTTVTEE